MCYLKIICLNTVHIIAQLLIVMIAQIAKNDLPENFDDLIIWFSNKLILETNSKNRTETLKICWVIYRCLPHLEFFSRQIFFHLCQWQHEDLFLSKYASLSTEAQKVVLPKIAVFWTQNIGKLTY